MLAAGLKAIATWNATDTIQECREACGAQGYLAVNRFASLKADTDVFSTFEGDNFVLLQLVAKALLTGYKRQFGGMRLVGLVRYVAKQAAVAVTELNPVITRLTDEQHLRDPDFQVSAFRWREQHLLAALARRLKKRLDGAHGSVPGSDRGPRSRRSDRSLSRRTGHPGAVRGRHLDRR